MVIGVLDMLNDTMRNFGQSLPIGCRSPPLLRYEQMNEVEEIVRERGEELKRITQDLIEWAIECGHRLGLGECEEKSEVGK